MSVDDLTKPENFRVQLAPFQGASLFPRVMKLGYGIDFSSNLFVQTQEIAEGRTHAVIESKNGLLSRAASWYRKFTADITQKGLVVMSERREFTDSELEAFLRLGHAQHVFYQNFQVPDKPESDDELLLSILDRRFVKAGSSETLKPEDVASIYRIAKHFKADTVMNAIARILGPIKDGFQVPDKEIRVGVIDTTNSGLEKRVVECGYPTYSLPHNSNAVYRTVKDEEIDVVLYIVGDSERFRELSLSNTQDYAVVKVLEASQARRINFDVLLKRVDFIQLYWQREVVFKEDVEKIVESYSDLFDEINLFECEERFSKPDLGYVNSAFTSLAYATWQADDLEETTDWLLEMQGIVGEPISLPKDKANDGVIVQFYSQPKDIVTLFVETDNAVERYEVTKDLVVKQRGFRIEDPKFLMNMQPSDSCYALVSKVDGMCHAELRDQAVVRVRELMEKLYKA